jgi:hypothetical protein
MKFFMPPPWNGRRHIVLPFVIPSFHNHGFRSISLEQLNTFNSNLVYGYIIELCRSGSNLVMVQWFFDRVIPLEKKIQFLLLTFVWMYVYKCWNSMCRFVIGMNRSSSIITDNWLWVLVRLFITNNDQIRIWPA